jgi:uncharacterized repeat protein (TIGR02543 family)
MIFKRMEYKMNWRIERVLLFLILIGILMAFKENDASDFKKKASAGYCMTCGCRNEVSLDNETFIPSIEFSPGHNGEGTCYAITTSQSSYAYISFSTAIIGQMKGKRCRLSGYYRTDAGRMFDMYGEYQSGSLGYIYKTGIGSEWQKFEYHFDFENVFSLTSVSFKVRSPDENSTVYIDGLELCTYYGDEPRNLALLSDLTISAGNLEPSFNSSVTSYSVNVENVVTTVTVTPTAKIQGSTILVNDIPVESTRESQDITLTTGIDNTIIINVSAVDYVPVEYKIYVNRGIDARLSNLILTPAPLSMDPSFDKDSYEYTASFLLSNIIVTATSYPVDGESIIKVNGIVVPKETPSGNITLKDGPNEILVKVIPPAGEDFAKTYKVNAIRGWDRSLKSLTLTDESSNVIPYTPTDLKNNSMFWSAIEDPVIERVTITAVPNDPSATIVYLKDGIKIENPVQVECGEKTIQIGVIASDNSFGSNFVVLSRGIDASLSSLGFTVGTVGKYDDLRYFVNVGAEVNTIQVRPTARDQNRATIDVISPEGIERVTSGTLSGTIRLLMGAETTIDILVTACDTKITKKYTATVIRAGDGTTPYITFDPNGGIGAMPYQYIASGTTVALNANTFTRAGYVFTGWGTSSEGPVVYADQANYTMGESNVRLYAIWTPNQTYTVTYNGNGNTGGTVPVDGNTYAQGQTVTVLGNTGNLTKTCNTFAGWNTAANGSGTNYSAGQTFPMGSSNVTLWAVWTINPYTITFNANGGSGTMSPQTINCGTSANLTANAFTRTCNTFAGWATSAGGAVAYANGASYTMGSSNVTLWAVWTINPYTITFNANGGSGTMSNQTIGCGSSANLTSNAFTRTGYNFAGWATTAGGAVAYANGANYTMGSANVTLYAVWTQTFTVTYNGNGSTGGTVPVDNNAYTTGSTVTTKTNSGSLSRTCYTFAGWNTAADGSGTSYAEGATFSMGSSNVTLYAKWTQNSYSITFNANGGTGTMSNQTIGCGSSANLNSNTFTRTCYSFAGWATTAGGAVAYANGASYTMGSSNVTLWAVWTINPYTITFNANGGSGTMSPQTINCGTSANLNANTFTRTCNTFSNWNTAANGSGTSYANGASYTMGTSNVTLYARWAIIPYTVTFNSQGGSSVSPQTVNCGGHVSRPNDPTLACNTFGVWSSPQLGRAWDFGSDVVTGNMTLDATWYINRYTLNVTSENGSIFLFPEGGTYDCGTEVWIYAEPNPGFKLTGYTGDASGNGPWVSVTMDRDKYVTANYVRRRVYVDNKISSGDDNGTSWANAYRGYGAIDRALDAAWALGPSVGDEAEVWVAANYPGDPYVPTRNYDPNASRRVGFALVPYVKLYGGFAGGNESETVENRQMSYDGYFWRMVNETTMSGDINSDNGDLTNDGRPEYSEYFDDNSYCVTIGADNATLDGFTIRDGNADDPNCYWNGGAMDNWYTSPTVKNCIFVNNKAQNGGAISNQYASPNIINCGVFGNFAEYNGSGIYDFYSASTIENNYVAGQFGGVWNGGGIFSQESNTVLKSCVIAGNQAWNGAGIYLKGGITGTTANVENCLIDGNYASVDAGGIWIGSGTANTIIRNCTIAQNGSYEPSVGNGHGGVEIGGSTTIYNTILWNNYNGRSEGGNLYYQIYNSGPTPLNIYYCDIQGGISLGIVGPSGINETNNQSDDPLFNSDFTLDAESPCIDHGSNSFAPSGVDLRGNPRISGSYVDMGAYEYQH